MIKAAVLLLALSGTAWGQDIQSLLPVVVSSGSRTAGITSDGKLSVNDSTLNTTSVVISTTVNTLFKQGQLIGNSSFTVLQGSQWNVITIATPTYSAAIATFTAAATPTDVFTITGSASKTIRIKSVRFNIVETNSSVVDVILLKRSSANSGGTSTTLNNVPLDSNNPAATATVRAYTVNPTVGTLVGNIKAQKVRSPAAIPLATGSIEFHNPIYDNTVGRGEIVLRGTSEVVAINLNGVTHAGNIISASIEWTEE